MAKKKDEGVQEELQVVAPPEAPAAVSEEVAPEPMYLIENVEARIYGYPVVISEGPPRQLDTRVLGPGITEVSQAEFDAVRKDNVVFKHALKEGKLVLRAKTEGKGLGGVPDKEAAGVIAQTFDLKLLEKWKSFANTSAQINLAIANRISFMRDELRKRGEVEAA